MTRPATHEPTAALGTREWWRASTPLTFLVIVSFFVLLAVRSLDAQSPPGKAEPPPRKTEVYQSTVALVIDAPRTIRPEMTKALATHFGALSGVDVIVFDRKFERTPDWIISISADASGDAEDRRFLVAVAFSRAVGLADPEAVKSKLESDTPIPPEVVKRLVDQSMRSVSDFKALWVAQGSMKNDLDPACSKAASMFDSQFLEKERLALRLKALRPDRPMLPPGPRPPGPR